MQEAPAYRYDAFISYRHLPHDMAIAERLQKLLEGYKPPKDVPIPADYTGRVFRDQSELPVSIDLGGDIRQALAESHFLVVICTPELQQSLWCMEEIRYFKELHSDSNQNILTVLASGEPKTAFPPTLLTDWQTITLPDGTTARAETPREPLAAGIAAANTAESLKLLKSEFLRIAAPILGCRYDDLYQRHRRRARSRAIAGVSAGAVALVAAFGLILNSVNANNAARLSAREAEQALSQSYALRSAQELSAGDRVSAIRLALEAMPGAGEPTPASYGALFSALYSESHADTILRHTTPVADACYSADSRFILTAAGRYAYLWDADAGEQLRRFEHSEDIYAVALSQDATHIAAAGQMGYTTVWNAETGEQIIARQPLEGSFATTSTVADLRFTYGGDAIRILCGKAAATCKLDGSSSLFYDIDSRYRYLLTIPHSIFMDRDLFIGPDGLRFIDPEGAYNRQMASGLLAGLSTNSISASAVGTYEILLVVTSDSAYTLSLYGQFDPPQDEAGIYRHGSVGATINRTFEYGFISGCILENGNIALACTDNLIRIYSPDFSYCLFTLYGHEGLTYQTKALPGSNHFITASHDGTARIWNGESGALLGTLELGGPAAGLELSPNGQHFYAFPRIGSVRTGRFNITDALSYIRHDYPVVTAYFDDQNNPVLVVGGGPEYLTCTYDPLTGDMIEQGQTEHIQASDWNHPSTGDDRFTPAEDTKSITLKNGTVITAGDAIRSVSFAPDNNQLALVTELNIITVHDTSTGSLLNSFGGSTFPTFDIAYTPNGQMLYGTAQDGTVSFWDPATGALLSEIKGMGDLYYPDYMNPANPMLFSALTSRPYHPAQLPNRIENVFPARMNSDGTLLLVPAPRGIRIYATDPAVMAALAQR